MYIKLCNLYVFVRLQVENTFEKVDKLKRETHMEKIGGERGNTVEGDRRYVEKEMR